MILPLAALAAGVLLSRLTQFGARELYVEIAAFAFLWVLSRRRHARLLAAWCALGTLVLSGTLIDVLHRPGRAPELDTEDQVPVVLAGCVVEPPAFSNDREQFILELAPAARARVSLYLREGEQPPPLRYGQRIEVDAKVRRPHNFQNPGAFDYVHYLARQYVFWTASMRPGASVTTLPGQCGNPFWRAIFAIRTAALDRIEELYKGNPYNIGMMQAILIGETSKMDKVWTEEFRSTGTFHALVISGGHVAVLAAFLLFLLRICFVPRGIAILLTVAAAWLYALVTGWQAPVIRSAAGMTLFAICRCFYRQGRILNLLSAIAIAFLVCDPEQMFDPSFQLSFISVALIGAFVIPLIENTSGPLSRGLEDLSDRDRDIHLPARVAQSRVELRLLVETLDRGSRVLSRAALWAVVLPVRAACYFYELMLTSAAIQVGLALPMAIYFHRVSFSGLSANAIVVPLLGAVIPAGFVAVFTGWRVPATIAGWFLNASQAAVNFHARLEPNWRIPHPPLWLSIAFSAALIIAALRLQWKWLRAAAVLAVLLLLAILVRYPFAPDVRRGALEMTAIDVGQGDSVLITSPDGQLLLIDGGGITTFGKRAKAKIDIGEDVVSPYLWTRGIRHLDAVALTHAHEDHIGGLAAILDDFDVGELWTGAMPDCPAWDTLRDKAIARHVRIVARKSGEHFDFGGAKVEVLAPVADYVPGDKPKNNDSLVMRLAYGRHSFLLTGDMEKQIENELVAGGLAERTDVLKVGHHGSRTSTTPQLLDAVHPALAVISAGYENSYGHPNKQTLEHLEERHIAAWRTDQRGLVSVRTDGRFLRVLCGGE